MDEPQFTAFLSHDWGDDELQRQNHARVKRVGAALERAGLRPWLDESEMSGNIDQCMTAGIENSKCVLIFVTARYVRKVSGKGPNGQNDNCLLEFGHAMRQCGVEKMVPVVMEAPAAGLNLRLRSLPAPSFLG